MPTHLTRNKRENCVMARVRRAGRSHLANFSLKKHGTWEAAEMAARAWLDELLPTLPPPVTSKNLLSRRNRSGVVGVHYAVGRRRAPAGGYADYPTYIARWPGAGAGLSFYVSTYGGEEGAFLHACVCRRLETKDRAVVEEAVRLLTPAERNDWLTRRGDPDALPASPEPTGTRSRRKKTKRARRSVHVPSAAPASAPAAPAAVFADSADALPSHLL